MISLFERLPLYLVVKSSLLESMLNVKDEYETLVLEKLFEFCMDSSSAPSLSQRILLINKILENRKNLAALDDEKIFYETQMKLTGHDKRVRATLLKYFPSFGVADICQLQNYNHATTPSMAAKMPKSKHVAPVIREKEEEVQACKEMTSPVPNPKIFVFEEVAEDADFQDNKDAIVEILNQKLVQNRHDLELQATPDGTKIYYFKIFLGGVPYRVFYQALVRENAARVLCLAQRSKAYGRVFLDRTIRRALATMG
jgi:hypothetical protein